jgi:hypothetical protein
VSRRPIAAIRFSQLRKRRTAVGHRHSAEQTAQQYNHD